MEREHALKLSTETWDQSTTYSATKFSIIFMIMVSSQHVEFSKELGLF